MDRVTSIDDQIRACNRVGGVAGEKERCGPYFLWKGESPRPSSASRAPLLAKSSAMALPMPAPAPVTMATLPSSMNPAAARNPKAYRSFAWDIGAENFPAFQTFKNRAKSSGEAVLRQEQRMARDAEVFSARGYGSSVTFTEVRPLTTMSMPF